jgi:hypothetical protein
MRLYGLANPGITRQRVGARASAGMTNDTIMTNDHGIPCLIVILSALNPCNNSALVLDSAA